MYNVTKNAKVVLFASLVAALVVSFGGANLAFGEVSEEIKTKALEGKQIWEKIEDIKNKEIKTEKDELYEKELQKQFDSIAKEMNSHGIATKEQWKEDPQYWRNMNLPPLHEPEPVDNTHDSDSFEIQSGNLLETTSHSYCNPCNGPQKLYVIAGFDYELWGFWPTSAYSVAGWKTLTYNGDEDWTTVTLEDDHDEITPHITQNIRRSGIVTYDYGYDARIYGTLRDSNFVDDINAIQVRPDSISITEDPIEDVFENMVISYDVTVTKMK